MPSDAETEDACAKWYGSSPVPKAIAEAWHAGRTDSQRPIPEGYLTVQQAATRFGINLKHLRAVLASPIRRKAAFPGVIGLPLRRGFRWYLPPAEAKTYRAPRPVDTQQAVIDAIQTLQEKSGHALTVEAISQQLGYKAGLVAEHLRVLKRDGIVSETSQGYLLCPPQETNE